MTVETLARLLTLAIPLVACGSRTVVVHPDEVSQRSSSQWHGPTQKPPPLPEPLPEAEDVPDEPVPADAPEPSPEE